MRRIPARKLAPVLLHKLVKTARHRLYRAWGVRTCTYYRGPAVLAPPHYRMPAPALLARHRHWIEELAGRYLAHRFNLLGSGWIHIHHGMMPKGFDGVRFPAADTGAAVRPVDPLHARHRTCAMRLWDLACRLQPGYVPIDWHIAFKSGHRWDPRRWHDASRAGLPPGVDIKEPWELSRMQHLVVLAYAYGVGDAAARERCLREFQAQILDFIAQNPPGFGVNWACPMDIAIRLVNWLVACDFFRTAGASLDADFEQALARSIHDHAAHVIRHREYSPVGNNNHYLADVCGLVYAGIYLQDHRPLKGCLRFAVRELARETLVQFNPDGSCREGSTSYHRLSSEMVAHTFALLVASERAGHRGVRRALRGVPLAPLVRRLRNMARFSRDLTAPSGRAWQIGDNDNGRFLKLHPAFLDAGEYEALHPDRPFEGGYAVENTLDHRPTAQVLDALLGFAPPSPSELDPFLDYHVVRDLLQGSPLAGGAESPRASASSAAGDACPPLIFPRRGWHVRRIPCAGDDVRAGLTRVAYPDFGVYIYRSGAMHLVIRCRATTDWRRSGHVHEDQYALCLHMRGRDVVVDPGTYVYTPFPAQRNRYRAAGAHFSPYAAGGIDAAYLTRPPFADPRQDGRICLRFDGRRFVGGTRDGRAEIMVRVRNSGVWLYSRIGPYPEVPFVPPVPPSCGYGHV